MRTTTFFRTVLPRALLAGTTLVASHSSAAPQAADLRPKEAAVAAPPGEDRFQVDPLPVLVCHQQGDKWVVGPRPHPKLHVADPGGEALQAPSVRERLAAGVERASGTAKKLGNQAAKVGQQVTESIAYSLTPPQRGPRGLTVEEIALLSPIFGDKVDYAKVRIVEFDLVKYGAQAVVMGNRILVAPQAMPISKELLVHEMAHVWQYQNGGWGYVPRAIRGQRSAEGYDFIAGLCQGKRWEELNPEQQAAFVERLWSTGFFEVENPVMKSNGQDITPFAQDVANALKERRGA
jgi:hypothetical protein